MTGIRILSKEETLKALDCCLSVDRKCGECPQNSVCGPYVKNGILNVRKSAEYWINQEKQEKKNDGKEALVKKLKTNEIMISIHPKWCELIRAGQKIDEIRKTKPSLTSCPAKVYIYQAENGGVIGEFELRKFTYIQAWKDIDGEKHLGNTFGLRHCVNDRDLFDYLYRETSPEKSGGWAWRIENLNIYDEPMSIKSFGLKRPPQSWCYLQ